MATPTMEPSRNLDDLLARADEARLRLPVDERLMEECCATYMKPYDQSIHPRKRKA